MIAARGEKVRIEALGEAAGPGGVLVRVQVPMVREGARSVVSAVTMEC